MRVPLHRAVKPSYVHDWLTKLCRREAEVIRNFENAKCSPSSTRQNTQHNVQGTET
jgi:hypothetical protein